MFSVGAGKRTPNCRSPGVDQHQRGAAERGSVQRRAAARLAGDRHALRGATHLRRVQASVQR